MKKRQRTDLLWVETWRNLELAKIMEVEMSTSSTPPPETAPVPDETKSEKVEEQQSLKRPKPTRVLPSERISFSKQLDILRAYVAASSVGTKACSLSDVAGVIGMNPNTVSVANPFFTGSGLIQRAEGGFLPSPDVIAFQRAYEWDPETAPLKLANSLRDQWFLQALSPRLSFGPLEEDAAIGILADSASAGPDYRVHLRLLIDYLVAAGLVIRDGGQIKLAKSQPGAHPKPQAVATPHEQSTVIPNNPAPPRETSGRIQVSVSIDVDMVRIAGWQPDRISAFFSGIAQVIAAKGGEKD